MADTSDLPPASKVDLRGEAIHWDLGQSLSYSQYLHLDRLLDCQKPLSTAHDEVLFIVIHQTSEIWMKLMLHELGAARALIAGDLLDPVFKMLARVQRIQEQLIQSWNILATMTPHDYLSFRNKLGHSSGFQSYQYRLLEFCLGNKNAQMIEVHRNEPKIYQDLQAALATPSLYDETLLLMARRGFAIPAEITGRDWREPHVFHPKVEEAWLAVYRAADTYWDCYELAEKLVDIEQKFQQWRFSHMKTVERIIGHKRGTGGSAGVDYLAKALELRFFPELWSVRTLM
ncbi:MAG: tryptophan 2,3-dioxygenase [Gammaproteobacteria bacterium]